MGENVCKPRDQQGINLQNLQTGHMTQNQKKKKRKKKKLNQEMGKKTLKKKFIQGDTQMAKRHRKRCSI